MGITSEKGDIGLTKAIYELTTQKYSVSLPISESKKYDLIIEKDNICKTVQVRYSKISERIPSIVIKLASGWSDKQKNHIIKRNISDYDILAVYCPNTDSMYYLEAEEFKNGTTINLRIEKPNKFCKKSCRMAKDYEDINRIFIKDRH